MSTAKKSSLELFRLRKTLNALASKEGSHTELITLYVPPGKQISDAINMLRDEYGTASNIKSTTTRKNVQEAIVKVQQRLKLFRDPGEKGLVIFCGAIPQEAGDPGCPQQADLRGFQFAANGLQRLALRVLFHAPYRQMR